MAITAAGQSESVMIGIDGDSSGNDLIRLESSITFNWVPDPGQQYVDALYTYVYSSDGSINETETDTSGISRATGTMTFTGVSSSEVFQALPSYFNFEFTHFGSFHPDPQQWTGGFYWDPKSHMLLQSGIDEGWGNHILTGYETDQAYFDVTHGYTEELRVEYGHWALVPDPENIEAFGGAGNDTIYGGQGNQLLSGDGGNDSLFAGLGSDTLLGGDGNDVVHGGIGTQILDGGSGNDTIYGGSGNQILMGDDGRDFLQAGSGNQIVLGGAGNDTILGGVGAQLLMGGDGRDYIQAGRGNETLLGGAGRDVFAFGSGVQGQIVIGDFTPAEDLIEVARGTNGLVLNTPLDLAAHVSSNTQGDAVLNLGGGATVTLSHIPEQRVTAHLQVWFKII